MKPPPFEYMAPENLEEALAVLAERPGEARPLAGGQSLIPMLNFRLARPELLVDLNRIRELDFVRGAEEGNGALRIGAMARQRALERDPAVAARAPLLAEAAPWIAHPQIRTRGTVGGSVAHADPAAELPAVLLALDARFRLASRGGDRWIAADEFFVGPFFTALAPDELLVEIEVPGRNGRARTGSSFLEIARRRGDYALAGVAVEVAIDADGACRSARIGLINAAPAPRLASAAAEILVGGRPTEGLIRDAAERAAREDADPAADLHASAAYRRHLVEVLVRRALESAFARAGAGT